MPAKLLLSLALLTTTAFAKFPESFAEPLEVIAFGSCNRDELPQVVWPAVEANTPDLWIWAGDNIYTDWHQPEGKKVKYTVNREWITERYATMFRHPAYAPFREKTPILGTWDDHDYGKNNGTRDFELKEVTRDLALSFLEVPLSDPRWTREGLYGSYDFGPSGKRTRIILTDNRYFATKPKAEDATTLGNTQKAWLEAQLRESAAELHIIVSGSQVISNKHRWDSWGKFPEEREWLLELIRETGQRVIILSGDRHIHEISVLDDDSMPFPLVDITSSGMTHSWENFPGEENPHRFGEVYTGLGFGIVRIDWSGEAPKVKLEIRSPDNELQNSKAVVF